jgi:hypothetical protein
MNAIIRFRTTPNIRHTIKGILLAEMLNRHLRMKIQTDLIRRKEWEAEHIYADSVFEIYLESSDDEKEEYKKLIS